MKSQYSLFEEFKTLLNSNTDVFFSYNNELNTTIIFQEQLCSIAIFNRQLLPNLISNKDKNLEDVLTGLARQIEFKDDNKMDLLLQILFSGLLLYYDHNRNIFLLIDISQALRRSTSDSIVEPKNILGSRDGFTENFKDNIALIRTRLKCGNITIDEFMIGERSKTWLGVLSIDDIHNQEIKKELNQLISKIKIDGLLSVEDIMNEKSFSGAKYQYVGSPDLACKYLLEGQFVIIIDRIPMVIILPTTFGLITKLRIDEVGSNTYKIFQRTLILFALLSSLLLPSLLVSFITFQSDTLSLTVLSTLLVTQKGAIFPPSIEVLMILLLFEFYYLIAFRSSEATISSTIVLIGGLIIGQNAIDSGIVGVIVMTVVALSFLSTFVVTNNIAFISNITVMRLINLFASFFFGIYGLTLALITSLIYLSNMKFLGIHFTSPFIPINIKDLKLFIFSRTSSKNKERVNVLKNKDRTSKE
ncbi:MAG: spore germination protein [bacterium]